MNYPELLLVPVFMLLDSYLTLVAKVLSKKTFTQHIKAETFELNPIWQSDVAKERWLNPKHLALTSGMTILLILLFESGDTYRDFVRFVLGMLLGSFGMVIGNHLSAIGTYVALNRNPQLIDGQITVTPVYLLYTSMATIFVCLIPLTTAAVVAPSAFLSGAVLGVALNSPLHLLQEGAKGRCNAPRGS